MTLEPIYFDNDVMITDHLLTFFGVSYPVHAISSIKIHRKETASNGLIMCGIAVLCGLGILLIMVNNSATLIGLWPAPDFGHSWSFNDHWRYPV